MMKSFTKRLVFAGFLCVALSIPMAAQNDGKTQARLYIPQIVDGGSWTTSFVIYNPSTRVQATGSLDFHTDTGTPLQLTVIGGGYAQQTTSHVSLIVPANGSVTVETLGQSPFITQGYATLLRGLGGAAIVAIFRQRIAGRPDFETSILGILSIYPALTAPFDNSGGFSTAFALANTDSATAIYAITFYDPSGGVISADAISIPVGQHLAFSSSARFPDTVGKVGTVQISRSGLTPTSVYYYPYMALTVLRFNPTGASSIMPMDSLQ
jgi:hypothetical protein